MKFRQAKKIVKKQHEHFLARQYSSRYETGRFRLQFHAAERRLSYGKALARMRRLFLSGHVDFLLRMEFGV